MWNKCGEGVFPGYRLKRRCGHNPEKMQASTGLACVGHQVLSAGTYTPQRNICTRDGAHQSLAFSSQLAVMSRKTVGPPLLALPLLLPPALVAEVAAAPEEVNAGTLRCCVTRKWRHPSVSCIAVHLLPAHMSYSVRMFRVREGGSGIMATGRVEGTGGARQRRTPKEDGDPCALRIPITA